MAKCSGWLSPEGRKIKCNSGREPRFGRGQCRACSKHSDGLTPEAVAIQIEEARSVAADWCPRDCFRIIDTMARAA